MSEKVISDAAVDAFQAVIVEETERPLYRGMIRDGLAAALPHLSANGGECVAWRYTDAQGFTLGFKDGRPTRANFTNAETQGGRIDCAYLPMFAPPQPVQGDDNGWQPIETAPRPDLVDGRVVGDYLLGYFGRSDAVDPQSSIDVIWWEPVLIGSNGKRGCWQWAGDTDEAGPTHWQALPTAPAP